MNTASVAQNLITRRAPPRPSHPIKTQCPWTFPWSAADHSLQYLMHARYYGSNLGRFMRPDPLALKALMERALARPQAWNLYSYVLGNPVLFTDPTGMTINYSDDFRKRLKSDATFKKAFEDWKKTDAGKKQWESMKKDKDTTYKFDVGRTLDAGLLSQTKETHGATNPGAPPNGDPTGKANQPELTMRINVDYHEEGAARNGQEPAKTAKDIADTMFHEGLHGLDYGSDTKTWAEADRSSRVLDSKQQAGDPAGPDPRLEQFEQQIQALQP